MVRGTLSNWRTAGKGPKFLKVGKMILYRIEAVRAWEEKQEKRSTVG